MSAVYVLSLVNLLNGGAGVAVLQILAVFIKELLGDIFGDVWTMEILVLRWYSSEDIYDIMPSLEETVTN